MAWAHVNFGEDGPFLRLQSLGTMTFEFHLCSQSISDLSGRYRAGQELCRSSGLSLKYVESENDYTNGTRPAAYRPQIAVHTQAHI